MHFVGNYKCKNQNGNAPQPQIRKYKHGFSSVFFTKFLFAPIFESIDNANNQNGNTPQSKIRRYKHGFQVFQGSTIVLSPQM